MADYANSLLSTAQALIADKFAQPEFRHKDYSITRIMLANADYVVENLDALKTSDQRAVSAYALSKTASDAATNRSYNHSAAANGDSQVVSLSWATKAEKFKTSLKIGDRNFISQAKMLAGRMESAWINLMDTIEGVCAAYLASYKSQVQAASNGELGEWDAANYIWQIDNTNKNYFFQYVQSMMQVNKYNGMIDFIADPVAYAIAVQLMNQGAGNGTNTSFQFGNIRPAMSSSLTADSSFTGWGYAIAAGTVGIIPWIPRENRENVATRLQTYTTMNDPFGLGLTAALHIKETAADTNDNSGEYQDEVVEYELSLDVANVKAPLSVTDESTIFKAGLLVSGGA